MAELGDIQFPEFRGDRLYMHQINLEADLVLPMIFNRFSNSVKNILSYLPNLKGLAYLTIDEKFVKKGTTHRRGGAHIDGNYIFGWGNGGGWLTGTEGRKLSEDQHKLQYCSQTGGLLIASNYTACRSWVGEFKGVPNQGGDCEHLRDQLNISPSFLLKPNKVYCGNSTNIHESLPVEESVNRTLIRITLPSNIPIL